MSEGLVITLARLSTKFGNDFAATTSNHYSISQLHQGTRSRYVIRGISLGHTLGILAMPTELTSILQFHDELRYTQSAFHAHSSQGNSITLLMIVQWLY